MGRYELLVASAGILGLTSFSTLLQRIYKTHNTTSLPWPWIIMNILAQTFSFIYGVANGAYGMYITNALFLMGLCYILYVKLTTEDPPPTTTTEKEK